jgi:hypothetical protein
LAGDLPVGRFRRHLSAVSVYALAGAAGWAVLGAVLGVLPLQLAALIAVMAYGAYYGPVEALGGRGVPPPGSRWQVPQVLVRNASRRRKLFIWGGILGPGFLTRNPYAGFGMLVALAALAGSAWLGLMVAAAIGACHGAGRALAMLRDARRASGLEYLNAVAKSLYWRHCDGFALVVIAATMLSGYRGLL